MSDSSATQRTALAWQRTAISALVLAAAAAGAAARTQRAVAVLVTALAAVAAAGASFGVRPGSRSPAWRRLLLVAGAVATMAVAGGVVAVLAALAPRA